MLELRSWEFVGFATLCTSARMKRGQQPNRVTATVTSRSPQRPLAPIWKMRIWVDEMNYLFAAYSRNNGGMMLQCTAAALAHCIVSSHSSASNHLWHIWSRSKAKGTRGLRHKQQFKYCFTINAPYYFLSFFFGLFELHEALQNFAKPFVAIALRASLASRAFSSSVMLLAFWYLYSCSTFSLCQS